MNHKKQMPVAIPDPNAPRVTRFYFQPDFPGKGDTFIVLAGIRWNGFMRRRIGITAEPFFERTCLPHEPDSFENGQPYAWIYARAELLIKDEQRWLAGDQLLALSMGIESAQHEVATLRSLPTTESFTNGEVVVQGQ